MQNEIDTIVFDLGGVLIDWNPRYVYSDIFTSVDAMEYFLTEVCTNHWNDQQDGGRSFKEATQTLISEFPHYTTEIAAYYGRWEGMLKGPINETVTLLSEIKDSGKYKIFALTNWSAESFPVALARYDFLHWFEGILVSGEEKMKKPDHKIFHLLLSRFNIDAEKALFIDDNIHNIKAANEIGFETIHFKDSDQCRRDMLQFLSL